MEELHDYMALRNKIYQDSPEARSMWTRTALKRRFAAMFTRMRQAAEVPQNFIVERNVWDKAYVSRLEGAHGGLPKINTITRFAEACDLTVALVVCEKPDPHRGEQSVRVIDAFSLYPEPSTENSDKKAPANYFIGLVGQNLSVTTEG
jgi:hypothetical protein